MTNQINILQAIRDNNLELVKEALKDNKSNKKRKFLAEMKATYPMKYRSKFDFIKAHVERPYGKDPVGELDRLYDINIVMLLQELEDKIRTKEMELNYD